MGKIEQVFIPSWVERRPAPLNMTDSQIVDWLGEYCDKAEYTQPTAHSRGGFTIHCADEKTTEPTLRDAVQMAAAKFKEANE